MTVHAGPPPSSSSFLINLGGGVCAVLVMFFLRLTAPDTPLALCILVVLAAAALPVMIGELLILRVPQRPRAALQNPSPPNVRRVRIKFAGFMAALISAGLIYFLFPEYDRPFYQPFFAVLPPTAAALAVLGWLYIAYTDRRLPQPEDSLYHFGLIVCGSWRTADKAMAGQFLRAAALRLFFVPVMYIYTSYYLGIMLTDDAAMAARKIAQITPDAALPHAPFFFVLLMAYLVAVVIDLVFATIGYLMTFRPLDADIRSIDATLIGWVCCLICYFPFWELFVIGFVAGEFYSNPAWYVWFVDNTLLLTIWGTLAIAAMTAESLATLSFGLRFSNLTYRGLISSGPFRLTKHPQYVAKIINRFLFYVPFLSLTGLLNAAWQCALFLAIAFVYYLRARTEEIHLSRYPEYVEYAHWIDEHGLFRFLGKIHPALKFNASRAQAGKILPF